MKQLALIGSTASGKTALSLSLAQKIDAYILSLDSLSLYREIDIASAKPTLQERSGIRHFGIDLLSPHEPFDVTTFASVYKTAYRQAQSDSKNLIAVGGTSFYLKILIDGISDLPTLSEKTKEQTRAALLDLQESHNLLTRIDPKQMGGISCSDKYRIEKMLDIYFETDLSPTAYFSANPPSPIITEPLSIYQIVTERATLRQRIQHRTDEMIARGLIDEVASLERKYSRTPNCMKAIGIKETLNFLDGFYGRDMLAEKITTNTTRLAKRQNTFNSSQFENVTQGSVKELEKMLL